jgi:hypothetical protein
MSSLNLNIIPSSAVRAAVLAEAASDVETESTSTHKRAEIAFAIPEPEDMSSKHVYPDLTTCHFKYWIPL